MATTQMNTRIETQLKATGDAALARAGYSPSQAVRQVWEWAVAHSHDPAAIEEFFNNAIPSVAEGKAHERERKLALVKDGLICTEALLSEWGITQYENLASARLSDHELRDLMYEEMLRRHEKGSADEIQ